MAHGLHHPGMPRKCSPRFRPLRGVRARGADLLDTHCVLDNFTLAGIARLVEGYPVLSLR